MREELFRQFQEYLSSSGLEIGDTIPREVELAEHFQVSRGDIREVIQHFAQLGLLKRVKRKGTVIQYLDENSLKRSFGFCLQMGGFCFEEMKEVRQILEGAIAPHIINRITPADLERLEENLRLQEAAMDDGERFEELDMEFHVQLFKCCRNRLLYVFTSLLPMLFERKYRERFYTRDWREIGLKSHHAIIRALRARDLKRFSALIVEHASPT